MTQVSTKIDLNEAALAYLANPTEDGLARVTTAGRALIHHFAGLYGSRHLHDDLCQCGNEALLKALRRYDAGAGASFVTYASHCIMGEMRHYFRREAAYYRPAAIVDLRSRLDREVEAGLKTTGRAPTLEELAKKLNVKKESIGEAMRAGLVSWDEVDIAKISHDRYESFKLPIEDRIVLEQAMARLTELQRKVIYSLFYKGLSQRQVSEEYHIHERKVSRVLQRGLKALRRVMS